MKKSNERKLTFLSIEAFSGSSAGGLALHDVTPGAHAATKSSMAFAGQQKCSAPSWRGVPARLRGKVLFSRLDRSRRAVHMEEIWEICDLEMFLKGCS